MPYPANPKAKLPIRMVCALALALSGPVLIGCEMPVGLAEADSRNSAQIDSSRTSGQAHADTSAGTWVVGAGEMADSTPPAANPDGYRPTAVTQARNADRAYPNPEGTYANPEGTYPNPEGTLPNPDGNNPNPDIAMPGQATKNVSEAGCGGSAAVSDESARTDRAAAEKSISK